MTDAAGLVGDLVARSLTIATAESLTGGLVCAALTDVPGSSAVVRGGVVAYATELKHGLLGVDEDLLAAGGAVQEEVARQMALGVCRALGAAVGVATTGVAGPDPQDGHPVGSVFVAAACGVDVRVLSLHLQGSRTTIRRETVSAALRLTTMLVRGAPAPARSAEDLGPGAG